jgi:hypothetical protein
MAAPYNPPNKNEDFIFYIAVASMATAGTFQVNPTIAAGDFQISEDGAAFTNLGTLPAVTPAGGQAIKVTLSSDEMNCDNVVIRGVDQTSPKEWADIVINIPTSAA